ncbi:MAG: methionine--tRNA ligase [Candidatus Liptonbacteria bacterium]|nr:methionine--tRNA ligase [Candidatus Liptonbacteria bacterium]
MGKKFYITTALDYVNAEPHLGHVLEKIQADVIARFHRLKGEEVLFLSGTDEHGVKVKRAAEAAGMNPREFVDMMAEKFKQLKDIFNLSYDDFIRTTDEKRHYPAVRAIWQKLVSSGDIYKKKYRGLYCVGHEAFITEKDLEDGLCRDHQVKPEVIEEENYFFRLSKYSSKIGSLIKSGELLILPEGRRNEILSLIQGEGLEDVSFSRPRKDLEWGIPVPEDDTHTIYVWADALTNYLSALDYPDQEFLKWWPAEVHLIGKDILRFHAGIWPGMLLSAGLPLPKSIFAHGFITVQGRKMSKTVGNIVDPVELSKKYGAEPLRYYLLKEIPSSADGDFSLERFKDVYESDLANGLGNFASRVLTLGLQLGEFNADFKDIEAEVREKIDFTKKTVEEKINSFKLNEAMQAIMALVAFGDFYVNKNEVWAIKDQGLKKKAILNLIVILDNISAALSPFLPKTAEKITQNIVWLSEETLEIKKGEVLFPRLL